MGKRVADVRRLDTGLVRQAKPLSEARQGSYGAFRGYARFEGHLKCPV